ncbi:MAG: PAS domain S-box protein [Planctomycetota bacterium]
MSQDDRSDAGLHDQPDWLRVTLSSIGDAVITSDHKGNVTFLNPIAQSLCGWTQADAVGQPLEIVFHIISEKTREAVESPSVRALRDGVIVGLANHTLLIARDGSERPIEDSAAPIRNASGDVAGVVLVFRDVTQRKQQEALVQKSIVVLQESKRLFLQIIDSLPAAVYTTDAEGRVTHFNTACIELTGRTPIIDSDEWCVSWKIFSADGTLLPHESCPMAIMLHGGQAVDGEEFIIERPDGTRRWIEPHPTPLRDTNGEITGGLNMLLDITDRKRSQEHLKAIEQRMRLAIEATSVGLWEWNIITDKVRWDTQMFRIYGVTPTEDGYIAYGTWASAVLAEDLPKQESVLQDTVRRLGSSDREFRITRLDNGECRFIQSVETVRTNANGNAEWVVGTNLDITEHKRAESDLRESEHRQRSILDTMPQKVFTATSDGKVDYYNPQWGEYLGLPITDILGSGWKQIVYADDLAGNVQAWQHSIDTGEPFEFESRFRRADGEYEWHINRARAMRNGAGAIVKWVGSNTNIQVLKRAELAVHVSENRYRRLFETAKDGILIVDFTTGEIVDANPFMTELLAYSHDEFSGLELWQIGLFSDKSANEAAVRELQVNGYVRYEHLPLESKDGRRIAVEVVANSYQEDSKSVIQFNIRDITDRNRLEKLLRGQASELSDLHRRKDEFLAMLSHELRSPLAPIANAVQLLGLQQGNESRIQQQARSIIERQLRQLQHLVDDLLEVSRITTGRVQLRLERCAVSNIVNGAIETARPLITQRRHDLSVIVPEEPIWLFADAARLEQVLVNLLSNAAKYTDEGGHLWLTVETEDSGFVGPDYQTSSAEDGDAFDHTKPHPSLGEVVIAPSRRSGGNPCAVIRVRDNGVGIDPSLLPRIFDLFTQAERSLDRSQGGLGIGLALVHRLTELHGGTVEAKSVLGKGSEFIVRLPLPTTELPHSALSSLAAGLHPSRPLRVLVVDDNPDTVLSFSMLLEAHGHNVRTASDGLAAIEVADAFKPDVMLLDIGLPGLNGYEVAKRVRMHPDLKETVLVALTGYGQDSDRQTSLEAGFNHHLVKPAILEQLLQILANVSERVK